VISPKPRATMANIEYSNWMFSLSVSIVRTIVGTKRPV
jgi:hypothetical protein